VNEKKPINGNDEHDSKLDRRIYTGTSANLSFTTRGVVGRGRGATTLLFTTCNNGGRVVCWCLRLHRQARQAEREERPAHIRSDHRRRRLLPPMSRRSPRLKGQLPRSTDGVGRKCRNGRLPLEAAIPEVRPGCFCSERTLPIFDSQSRRRRRGRKVVESLKRILYRCCNCSFLGDPPRKLLLILQFLPILTNRGVDNP